MMKNTIEDTVIVGTDARKIELLAELIVKGAWEKYGWAMEHTRLDDDAQVPDITKSLREATRLADGMIVATSKQPPERIDAVVKALTKKYADWDIITPIG